MFQRFLSEHNLYSFNYLLHMKMKKMLFGAFLGMFTLAGVAVLPNYANATGDANDDVWANPEANTNMISNATLE